MQTNRVAAAGYVFYSKSGAHLPLNRQSEVQANDGLAPDVTALGDRVDA